MGNVGDPNQLIVSSNWILKQGEDQYILKNEMTLDVSRPKFRDAIEIGPVNTFGAGDHSVPCSFEADITKAVNWVNLNARDQVTGFLPNLPYTLTLQSKSVSVSANIPPLTVNITNEKITSVDIESGANNKNTSILLSLSDEGEDRPGKLAAIVSEGKLIQVVILDQGEGYNGSAPTVTSQQVTSPVAFAFNAEVSTVTISPSDTEGRVKIDVTLTITDDAVLPVDA